MSELVRSRYAHRTVLASRSNFQRAHHGVYRSGDYPPTPREEVAAAWLALGKDVAVVTHDSALDLWDLSDAIPSAVHLSSPPGQTHGTA